MQREKKLEKKSILPRLLIQQNYKLAAFMYWFLNLFFLAVEKVKHRIAIKRISKSFASIGSNVSFDPLGVFVRPETIEIGDNVFIGKNSHISSQGLSIGSNILIGPSLIIECDDHIFDVIGKMIKDDSHLKKIEKVAIEDDVWIGARVTILKGVTIGMGSVVGAGSLVCKSVPPYTVAAGNPVKVLKKRFEDQKLNMHMKRLGYSDEQIRETIDIRNNMIAQFTN